MELDQFNTFILNCRNKHYPFVEYCNGAFWESIATREWVWFQLFELQNKLNELEKLVSRNNVDVKVNVSV